MFDAAARREPSVFKPLIDAALLRIGRKAGVDEDLATLLGGLDVPPGGGAWTYLLEALRAAQPLGLAKTVPDGEWAHYFLSGEHESYAGHTTHHDDDDDGSISYVNLRDYPREARPALRQGHFVGGYDADVIAMWRRADGRYSPCHAHVEGFWLLGQDPIDFIERAAMLAEGKTPPAIVDPEVEALASEGDDEGDDDE
jgi:hypothetical protein